MVYTGRYSKLHQVWKDMRNRCNNPRNAGFKDYGGRGIKVCEAWNSFDAFEEWAKDAGYIPGLLLDRRNNDLGYSPGNCRWVSNATSQRNRRNAIVITAWGESKHIEDWLVDPRCVVPYNCLYKRIKNRMNPELALTKQPLRN